jgi:PAS domain S-box-containing protein
VSIGKQEPVRQFCEIAPTDRPDPRQSRTTTYRPQSGPRAPFGIPFRRGISSPALLPHDSEAPPFPDQDIYRLLVEQTKDYAVFALDREGYVRTWNVGAERLKGYRAQEIIGKHFSTFYTKEDVARDWPARELQMASVEGRFEDEGWRVRKDGSRFWANVVITALRDEDGKLIGFSKITRDLTGRPHARGRAAQERGAVPPPRRERHRLRGQHAGRGRRQ